MCTERDIREAAIKYSDMLYRICIVILCNEQDVQDAIQDTFCKDMVRFRLRHPKVCIDELENSLAAPEHKETLRELLELPVKQKVVVYLHYVEGYQIKEIAEILGITEGAVKMRLCRAREQMRMTWKEGYGG